MLFIVCIHKVFASCLFSLQARCSQCSIKIHSVIIRLCIQMCGHPHDLMRCGTQMTAPCPWTICFLRNPSSTKCEYGEIPHIVSFCYSSLSWMNVLPSGLYLIESHCTRRPVHGSWKCLHLLLRFQPLRICRRRQSLFLPYTVCCALD